MRPRSGEHQLTLARYSFSRLVLLLDESRATDIAAAVRDALGDGQPTQGRTGFVIECYTDQSVDDAHAVVIADVTGEWACDRAAELDAMRFPGAVMVVTRARLEQVELRGYESGVLAWHVLPLQPRAFRAQLDALADRLVGRPDRDEVSVELDEAAHEVVADGCRVRFTRRPFAVFGYLLARRERWTASRQILSDVFGTHHAEDSSLVRNHVAAAREALGELAWMLQGEEGRGYRVTLRKDSSAALRGIPHRRFRRRP